VLEKSQAGQCDDAGMWFSLSLKADQSHERGAVLDCLSNEGSQCQDQDKDCGKSQ